MAENLTPEIKDFHDIIRLLEAHPEWRADLRRLVLTDDLLALPNQMARLTAQVQELVEAQRRTDTQVATLTTRVADLTTQVADLAEAQRRTDTQVAALTTQMADLAEAQRRTETQLESLTARTHDLANGQQRILDDLGTLKGRDLERMYREKAEAYFDTILRDPRVLSSTDIRALLDEATRRGTLAPGEQRELIRADLIIHGTYPETGATLYLVVEVSWGIRSADVERVARRAALLRKLGLQVFVVVAGEGIAPEVHHEAADKGVWQVIDGTALSPSPTT